MATLQPYTPSGQTPYMTPYQQTPHFSQTPRYGTSTPSQYSNKSAYTGIPTGHPPPSASHHGYKSTSAARGMGGVSSAASSSSSSLMMMQQPSPYSNSSDHHYRTQQPPMHHHARNNEYDSWSKATDSWSNRGNSSNMMKGHHGASERRYQPAALRYQNALVLMNYSFRIRSQLWGIVPSSSSRWWWCRPV